MVRRHTPTVLIIFVVALFTAPVSPVQSVHAQSSSSASLQFEVASIKPGDISILQREPKPAVGCHGTDSDTSLDPMSNKAVPLGRCLFGYIPLNVLASLAYEVDRNQVSGGPGWVESDGYSIEAKAQEPTTMAQLRRMLQTLLEDRFKLKVHRESRQLAFLALSQVSGGHKMKASEGDGPAETTKGPGGLKARMISMTELAQQLSRDVGMPVLDMTGLHGRYDFELNIAAYRLEGSTSSRPDPLEMMQQLLQHDAGLRLESRKGPVQSLIIDHVEKP